MRVLIIEDDVQDVRLLEACIAQDGLTGQVLLTHARSLEQARDRLSDGVFDVVLLDLGLPDGAGLDTYRRLADLAVGLPIVVLSGDADRDLAVAAVREGAQDYLVKGKMSGDALVRVLRYAIERDRVLARERAALRQERAAGQRLRELDGMKNAFLQAVSHELRTPLTSVLGYAATLKGGRDRLSDAQCDHMVERLMVNAERLRRLLDDLLDINRLSAGAVTLRAEPIDLATVTATVVAHIQMPQHHRLELDLQPCPTRAETAKVERIVDNLLCNAVKHTPPGTTVWVRTRPVNGGVVLTVEDDGPGVEDDLKGKIFSAFRQAPESQQAANPGTGIGLNLVAKFAELHSGRAWVDDRPGGGAAFHVLFSDPVDSSLITHG